MIKEFLLSEYKTIRSEENDCILYELKENGIVYTYYKEPQGGFSVEYLRTCKSVRQRLLQGEKRPFLTDASNVRAASKEVLTFLGSNEYLEGISAAAVIYRHPVQKFLAQVFFKLNNSKTPLRAYHLNDVDEALRWLDFYKT